MEQGKPDGGSFTGTSCFSDRGSCVIKNRGSLPAAWNADGISAGVRAVSFRLCLRGG